MQHDQISEWSGDACVPPPDNGNFEQAIDRRLRCKSNKIEDIFDRSCDRRRIAAMHDRCASIFMSAVRIIQTRDIGSINVLRA